MKQKIINWIIDQENELIELVIAATGIIGIVLLFSGKLG